MSFKYPWLLLLIPLIFWMLRKRRPRSSVIVASTDIWPDNDSGKARFLWLPIFLRRLTMCFIIVGIAGPLANTSFDQEVSEGIAIQLLVDVSSSMDMYANNHTGDKVRRIELAKQTVEQFIAGDGEELDGRPDDLIGLITFARYADTRSPLTFGHDALLQIVRDLEIQQRPNEDGTAYGDALAVAAARLKNLEELKHRKDLGDLENIKSRVIILLTDGENNSGAHLPVEAAGLAKAWGCRIYAISFGEDYGGSDELNLDNLTPSEQVLEHLCKETGGIFRKAYDYESLRSVYSEVDQLERTEITTQSAERLADWSWLLAGFALLTLSLALILEATCLRVVP